MLTGLTTWSAGGGIARANMISFSLNPIDVASVVREVVTPETGGINVFIGTTRNHSYERMVTLLEYEAYEPMALRMMEQLEQEARTRWPLQGVAVVHRLGPVPVGEASVVVAASASHRQEAFEACRYLIDALKREVPIWKREHFADGSVEWSGQASVTTTGNGS